MTRTLLTSILTTLAISALCVTLTGCGGNSGGTATPNKAKVKDTSGKAPIPAAGSDIGEVKSQTPTPAAPAAPKPGG